MISKEETMSKKGVKMESKEGRVIDRNTEK
jgi:hypothetical protein